MGVGAVIRGLGCEALNDVCSLQEIPSISGDGARLNEFIWRLQGRSCGKKQVRTSILSSASEAAASANRANVGSDPAPILVGKSQQREITRRLKNGRASVYRRPANA
jgi:hypothetical protein